MRKTQLYHSLCFAQMVQEVAGQRISNTFRFCRRMYSVKRILEIQQGRHNLAGLALVVNVCSGQRIPAANYCKVRTST